MIKRVLLAFVVLFLLASYLVYENLKALSAPPKFTVINSTKLPVKVTAKWRDSQIVIDNLKGTMTFTVQAEASMIFIVEYETGKTEERAVGYFTSGSRFQVQVKENNVIVSGI